LRIESAVVETGEFEVEQPHLARIQQEHVAVVRVVVAENQRLVWQAPADHLERRGLEDPHEPFAHLVLVCGEAVTLAGQHAACHRAPAGVQPVEERFGGQFGRKAMKVRELLADQAQDLVLRQVGGGQCTTGVEALEAKVLFVSVAAGSHAGVGKGEVHAAFVLEVEDCVFLALELAIQDRRRLCVGPGLDAHRERRKALGRREVEICDPEMAPSGQHLLAAHQGVGLHLPHQDLRQHASRAVQFESKLRRRDEGAAVLGRLGATVTCRNGSRGWQLHRSAVLPFLTEG
jgi:hypothetical protein